MVQAEIARLNSILDDCEVSDVRKEALQPLIENVAWIKIKLDDTREVIKNSGVVIPYDNGGGQKGLRENPMYKGYESLFKSYLAGMDKIFACLPLEVIKEEAEKIEKPKTMLELVTSRHKKEA